MKLKSLKMKNSFQLYLFNLFGVLREYKIILLKNNMKFWVLSFRDSTTVCVIFNRERLT